MYEGRDECLINKQTKTLVAGCKNSIIPEDGSVKVIGTSAFSHNNNLVTVVIPAGVEEIQSNAFCGCHELKTLYLPDSIRVIHELAFYDCPQLTVVCYDGTQKQWTGVDVKKYNSALSKQKVPIS